MKVVVSLAAVALIVACSNETTSPTALTPRGPAFSVSSSSAGGVSFAAGSGCTVVLSHFECSYTVENVPHAFTVMERAAWSYTYECRHKKTMKSSARYPAKPGLTTTTNLFAATVVGGQIVRTGIILSPVAPTDCAANKGAYTVTALVNSFTPNSWSLYAYSDTDPNNFFASMFEVL
jgi:hypothetical protein